jgi:hypothetical protein
MINVQVLLFSPQAPDGGLYRDVEIKLRAGPQYWDFI